MTNWHLIVHLSPVVFVGYEVRMGATGSSRTSLALSHPHVSQVGVRQSVL
jgi:hypothetical protein